MHIGNIQKRIVSEPIELEVTFPDEAPAETQEESPQEAPTSQDVLTIPVG